MLSTHMGIRDFITSFTVSDGEMYSLLLYDQGKKLKSENYNVQCYT